MCERGTEHLGMLEASKGAQRRGGWQPCRPGGRAVAEEILAFEKHGSYVQLLRRKALRHAARRLTMAGALLRPAAGDWARRTGRRGQRGWRHPAMQAQHRFVHGREER